MAHQNSQQRIISSQACNALPTGWFREELAVHGLNSRPSVCYRHSSNNQRARNKQELQKLLGDRVDLTNFDFVTGRFTAQRSIARPAHQTAPAPAHAGSMSNGSQHLQRSTNFYDISKAAALDSSVIPVKRRKETLAEKNVTLFRVGSGVQCSGMENKPTEANLKGPIPRQVYGIKRLDGVRSIDFRTGKKTTVADFSRYIKPLTHATPTVDSESLVESVAAQLLAGKPPVIGQRSDASGMIVNAEQPFAQVVPISDEDVAGQERRVSALRKQLADLIKRSPSLTQ